MTEDFMMVPTAPSGSWETLTTNEQAWIEFIRVISAGRDPKLTTRIISGLTQILDAG